MAETLTREELDRDLQNLVGGDLASDEIIREVLAHDAAQRAEIETLTKALSVTGALALMKENELLRAEIERLTKELAIRKEVHKINMDLQREMSETIERLTGALKDIEHLFPRQTGLSARSFELAIMRIARAALKEKP